MILINPHMEILHIRKIKGLWDPQLRAHSGWWCPLCIWICPPSLLPAAVLVIHHSWAVCLISPTLSFFICETGIWYGIYGAGVYVLGLKREEAVVSCKAQYGPVLCFLETLKSSSRRSCCLPGDKLIILCCFEFLFSLVFMLINALGDSLNCRDGSAGEINDNGGGAIGGEDWVPSDLGTFTQQMFSEPQLCARCGLLGGGATRGGGKADKVSHSKSPYSARELRGQK